MTPPRRGLSRRALLAGAAALAVMPGPAACAGSGATPAGAAPAGSPPATVTLGSRYSDAVPKQAQRKVLDAYTARSGGAVTVNTVDGNTFQEQINTYLQGSPDDVFTWSAGYRAKFFAAQGLTGDVSPVWASIGATMTDAFRTASTAEDGTPCFVPFANYPWAVFYRTSLFAERGYAVPETLDQLIALGDRMRADKLTPFAFADKDGWPAMGTFDALNMRINGYDFHIRLMAGKEAWDTPQLAEVFRVWAELLPYHQADSLGRTWQEAAQALSAKTCGMYLLGSFVAQQFTGQAYDDLDFFAFPQITAEHGRDAIDAPIDGYMMSARPKDRGAATALLEYLATGAAQTIYLADDPSLIAAANDADTSRYNPLQRKSRELIGSATHIAQFLDRDTRPDFASTVVIPSFQRFIAAPQDAGEILRSMQSQAKTIFPS